MSTLWPSLSWSAQGPHSDQAYLTDLAKFGTALPMTTQAHGLVKGSGLVTEPAYKIPTGQRQPGVNDTFYNRILLDPSVLELGNLLSNQTRSITLWNGFLEDRDLESFQRTVDDGITINQPVRAPYKLRALEQLTYVLNVSTDGPAIIDAKLTWTVNGVKYQAVVTGRRVVIWPYPPSWDTPVTENLQWLTNILRSYSGKEQRRALRSKPRRSFNYAFKTAREESARLENLLWGWQNRIYALPVWTDRPRLTSEVKRGDLFLALPTATHSFSAGNLAILYSDVRNMEVVEIDSVAPTGLSLKRPAEANWPVRTSVFPVVLGHLPNNVPMTRLSSQAVTGTLGFITDPSVTEPNIPVGTVAVTYNGLEVLLRQPNWKGGLPVEMQYAFETLDQQTGPITWHTTEEFPRIQRAYSWLLSDRTKIDDFRAFLGRRKGQQKAFYLPSWHDDFVITKGVGQADSAIYVKDNEFRLQVGIDPAREVLMIRLVDGTIFFRKIVGISSDGSNTILTLDSPFNRAITVDQFRNAFMLMKTRFATDDVNLVWRSNEVAVVDTTLITVKE